MLATVSATRSAELHHGGTSLAAALTSGYHLAFLIAAALVIAAIVVALAVRGGGEHVRVSSGRARGASARGGSEHAAAGACASSAEAG